MLHTLSANEYYRWFVYINEYEPPDVNEVQTAVLSNMIASFMGSKNSTYKNFLIRGKKQAKKKVSNLASAFAGIAKPFKSKKK